MKQIKHRSCPFLPLSLCILFFVLQLLPSFSDGVAISECRKSRIGTIEGLGDRTTSKSGTGSTGDPRIQTRSECPRTPSPCATLDPHQSRSHSHPQRISPTPPESAGFQRVHSMAGHSMQRRCTGTVRNRLRAQKG
jgi:hypothetical protein